MDYEEIPKYVKRKKSSVSKSRRKSMHKHEYVDCLLIENEGRPYKAVYCTVCGKVGDVKFCETEKTNHGTYRKLNEKEIFKKYMDFPQIHIKNIFQKYISIGAEDDK